MKEYRALLKALCSKYISALRKQQKITQQEMAEKLHITTRACEDLERGKRCSSAISLLFLIHFLTPEDRLIFLDEFWEMACSLEDRTTV